VDGFHLWLLDFPCARRSRAVASRAVAGVRVAGGEDAVQPDSAAAQ
jgi:hypothetical protein